MRSGARPTARRSHLEDVLFLGRDDLVTLARNSFLGSFIPKDEIDAHLANVEAYAAAN